MYPCLLHKFDDNASIHSPQKGSLEDKCADHQCYISSGSSRKDAKKIFNCISGPIFTSLFYLQVNDSYIVLDLHHTIFSLCCSIYRYKLSAGYWNLPTAVHSCSIARYCGDFQCSIQTLQHSQEVLKQVATQEAIVNGGG